MSKFNTILGFISIFLLTVLLIYGFAYSNNPTTGKAVLDLKATHVEGEQLTGVLKLSLKEGELIPANSRIVIENGGETYGYDLSDFISSEIKQGNFYIEGSLITGQGEGFGVEGEKKSTESIPFTLNIIQESTTENEPADTETTTEVVEETSETESQETQNVEETTGTQEEIIEEPIEEIPEEKPAESLDTENSEETITGELDTEEQELPEQDNEKASEQTSTESTSEETSNEPTEESQELSPITGNFISNFFNLFLGITGQASLEINNVIEGEVSPTNPFIYQLKEGESVELVQGSENVNLEIKDGEAIVSANYIEVEMGFGEEYLGEVAEAFEIDLSNFGINTKEGELKISLIYEDEEILSLTTQISPGEITATSEEEIPETIIPIIETTESLQLTSEEREALEKEFGNISVEVTKAEQTINGANVRYEIGEFWAERYYPEIPETELKNEVEKDITLFLKDLAKKLLEEGSSGSGKSQEDIGIIGSYKI